MVTGGSFLDVFVLQGSLKDSPLFEGSVQGLLRGFSGFFQGSSSFLAEFRSCFKSFAGVLL